MNQTGGGMYSMMGDFPDSYNLVVNKNHDVYGEILKTEDEAQQKNLISQLKDLALLSQGMLKGKDLTDFINRSVSMIK
jgi:molecular chaperone HtpG